MNADLKHYTPVWHARNCAHAMARSAKVRTRAMHIARAIKQHSRGTPSDVEALNSWVGLARMANRWLVRDAQSLSRIGGL